MTTIEQAIVLAAGEGSRLAPFTAHRPKPLLPFLNVPLLTHTLHGLARGGVRRVALNAFHLADQMTVYAESNPVPDLDLHVEVEETLLGTGGGLVNLQNWLEEGPFLVTTADIISNINLDALCLRHKECKAQATMTLVPDADTEAFGAIEIDEEGMIVDIVSLLEHSGIAQAVNGSMHLLEPIFLNHLPQDGPSCLVRDGYIPALKSEATVAAYLHDAPWAELGTPEGVLSAQRDALSGRLPIHPEILAMGGEATETNSIVHPTAQVDPAARLLRTTVGAGSVIEAGAHLTDVVVLPGGHAEAGVNLQGALLDTHREITDLQSAPA